MDINGGMEVETRADVGGLLDGCRLNGNENFFFFFFVIIIFLGISFVFYIFYSFTCSPSHLILPLILHIAKSMTDNSRCRKLPNSTVQHRCRFS